MGDKDFEAKILAYALDPNNQESFASLLNKILPDYTRWTWGKDGIYRRFFNQWQQNGFNLAPNHYYSPIPAVGSLTDTDYQKRAAMPGLDLREDEQLAFLDSVCAPFKCEYSAFSQQNRSNSFRFHFGNGAFERVDAEVLYSIIRHRKPRRMIEIGAGYSTLVSAAACEFNRTRDSRDCEFVVIEPFPNDLFKERISGLTSLRREPLQSASVDVFQSLAEDDILFIDSSHILKIGSDVQLLYLEIIPRLRPGVLIHVHDIFLPAEYPANWIKDEHVFWNEQYLLQAFLSFNQSFEVVWAGSFMHLRHPGKLAEYFPGYSPSECLPGSFWMRREQGASK